MNFVLFHSGCMDGFGAAWSAWTKFGDQATYIPVQYDQPLPDLPDADSVYILDFSYTREILERLHALLTEHNTLRVLDHHKTAQADLEGLDFAIFDQNKSGAVLAWEYFHRGEPLPILLEYIQDRDLWKWELPDSRAISAFLQLEIDLSNFQSEFKKFDYLCNQYSIFDMANEGRTILKYQDKLIQQCLRSKHEQAFWYTDEDNKSEKYCNIWSVNSPVLQSEIGNELAKEHGVGDVYYNRFDKEQNRVVRQHSLRSVGDFDVSVIAKSLGGGGHKNAAGFSS